MRPTWNTGATSSLAERKQYLDLSLARVIRYLNFTNGVVLRCVTVKALPLNTDVEIECTAVL
jgi:hypothetical protein